MQLVVNLLVSSYLVGQPRVALPPRARGPVAVASAPSVSNDAATPSEVDVVVIGSGYGGLSCAGLLATSGLQVAVLEQHYEIGGCAHEYAVNMEGRAIPSELLARKPEPVFKFEAGPSLYSGLSPERSPNPLKHIFQMIGEEPEWINYDTWGAHLPEVPEGYELSIGAEVSRATSAPTPRLAPLTRAAPRCVTELHGDPEEIRRAHGH